MGAGTVRVSFLDNLRFNLFHALPNYLQGLFLRRPFWVGVFSRLHRDPLGVRFAGRLRARYRTPYLRLRMMGTSTVLVLDPDGVRRVLERSPQVYADPRSKRKGMGHFQPGAVTVTRWPDWAERRRFNEAALCPGRPHPLAPAFLEVVRDEVRATLAGGRATLGWPDLEALFARVTLRVVFGSAGPADLAMLDDLRALMRRGNRLFLLRRGQRFDRLYARVRHHLAEPRGDTLAWLCREASPGRAPWAENQVPHWIFAMKDTLAANAAAALALVASRPDAPAAVRAELGERTADAVEGASYLGGCVQEAMRLWPTTPMLLREAIAPDLLGGEVLRPGTQVLIWNAAAHRDRSADPDAEGFNPQRWAGGGPAYRFNHLSNGQQGCPGKDLALFLAKAVLAELLTAAGWRLLRPPLPPEGPVPHAFNPYRLRLERRGR